VEVVARDDRRQHLLFERGCRHRVGKIVDAIDNALSWGPHFEPFR
jgi:hypothetical protein